MPEGDLMRARRPAAAPAGAAALVLFVAGVAVVLTEALATAGVAQSIAILVVVIGSVWFAWTKRTVIALTVLMLYLGGLDGYLKLSTGSSLTTLVRDVLLYAIVIGLLVRSQVARRQLPLPPFSGWVIAYVGFVLVQIPNPNGGTLLHSLAGVRPHLEFVPLFFLGYLMVRSAARLRSFVLLLLVLGAANGIVGYVQFSLTPQQLAAWGPGYADRVNGAGAFANSGRTFVDASGQNVRVRPFGLGSEAGAGGVFGVLALGGVLALVSLIARARYRAIAAILGVGSVAAIVTSEGRAVIVAAVATVLAYGILTATSQRRLASLAGVGVAAGLAYFVTTSIVATAGSDAFRYQGLSASKILSTTTSANGRAGQLQAITYSIAHYPLGAGLATAGPASGSGGASPLTGKLNAESEFSFLVLEAGVPGLVVVVGFTVMLLGIGLSRCRREPDPHARSLLAAVICPLAGILVSYYAGPATVTVPVAPYLWFVGGIIGYWLIQRPRELASSRTIPT